MFKVFSIILAKATISTVSTLSSFYNSFKIIDILSDGHFWHIPLENHVVASTKEETPLQTFTDFAPQPVRVVQQEEGKEA